MPRLDIVNQTTLNIYSIYLKCNYIHRSVKLTFTKEFLRALVISLSIVFFLILTLDLLGVV